MLQDTSLEPQPGSRLAKIADERGAEVDRHAVVHTERTLLCEVRTCSSTVLFAA